MEIPIVATDIELSSLESDWEELYSKVETRVRAHSECRSLNSMLDRALRIMALVTTSGTASLMMLSESLGDDVKDRKMILAELVLSSTSAIVAGLINLYNNAGQVQRHQDHIDKYTELRMKIDIARRDHGTRSSRSLWNKYRERYGKIQLSGISIFDHVRRKYNVSH
jgi:hypothetical protein